MPSQYLHSGEPLPLAPSLTDDAEHNVTELLVFHSKLLDYLRRLTAKLSSEDFQPPIVSGVSLPTIGLSLTADYSMSNPKTIGWDQLHRNDQNFYTYDIAADTGKVTILQDGLYLMNCQLFINDSSYLVDFVDGSGTTIPYGRFENTVAGTLHLCYNLIVHLQKDQTIEVLVTNTAAAVEEDRSHWYIIRIADFTLGDGGGSFDPCDLDIWQLCP